MNTNFTIYRRGRSVFKMESRQQGEIRKMSTATFHQEIMTDDSIKISLVSIKRIDFRLRDYIIYEDRPYFLNRLPQASIDESGRYVYQMTFEGGMFELGRKAFILHDAIGYDYYGNLAEFGRLIVRNMNDINMFIEWDETDGGTVTHRSAKFVRTARDTHDTTTLYMWGRGFGDADLNGKTYIYTDGYPVIDEQNPTHPVDPEDLSSLTDCVVTAVHQWTLDFPKRQETPAEYPPVPTPVPPTVYVLYWDTEHPVHEDIDEIGNSFEYEIQGFGQKMYNGVMRDMFYQESATVINRTQLDIPTVLDPQVPTKPGDALTIVSNVSYNVHYYRTETILPDGQPIVARDEYKWETFGVEITFRAVQEVQSSWQIVPITPPSGEPTSDDYPIEYQLLTYEDRSCLAVLQDLMDNWQGWEFVVEVGANDIGFADGAMRVCGVIKMRLKDTFDASHTLHNLGFGRGGGIHSIVRKYADESNIPSRIYFFGGSSNLPQYYRNTRLCLPNRDREDSYIDFAQFVQTNFQLGISNTSCEEVKIMDDIYPASNPFVLDGSCDRYMVAPSPGNIDRSWFLMLVIPKAKLFDIKGKWERYDFDDVPIMDADDLQDFPDYAEWLSMRGYGYSDTLERRGRYTDYYVGKSKYLQNATPAKFTFQTGDLAGYQLTMHDYYERTEDGITYSYVTLNVVNEDNEEVEGYHVPNENVICQIGDKFIIEDINMPPQYTYYQDGSEDDYSAENALWKAAVDYMNEVAEKVDYEISVARDFVKRNNVKFNVFDGIQFNDILSEYAPTLKKRIVSVELDLIDGYTYKLNITNRKMIRPTSVLRGILGIRNEK